MVGRWNKILDFDLFSSFVPSPQARTSELSQLSPVIYFYWEKIRKWRMTKTLITFTLYSRKRLRPLWRKKQMDGGRRRQTLLTYTFFSWPYHAVLSSGPHLAFFLLLGRGLLNRRPLWAAVPRTALRDSKLCLTQITLT